MSISRRRFVQAGIATAIAAPVTIPSTAAFATEPERVDGPKFHLGLVTYMVAAEWDVATILRICKSVGIGAVELRTTHKHGVETSLSKGQRADVRKQFADAGVKVWGSGTTCEFHAPDKAVVQKNIETCKQFVELVTDLGATGVKVRPNGLPGEAPPEKTIEQIGKALVVCGEAAKCAGVEIWVEVHGRGTAEPKTMRAIMEACGHGSVGVTWNSNGEDVKGGSVGESFALLKPWIKSCHINNLYNDMSGAYPYRELFQLLRGIGYDRYTLCEVGKAPPTPEAGEEFLRYYKALWWELAKAEGKGQSAG